MWNADGTREIWTIPDTGRTDWVSFSRDGKLLATSHTSGQVKLRDPATGKELRSFPGAAGVLRYGMALSPDGTRLAIGTDAIHIWSTADGKELTTLDLRDQYTPALAFASDSVRLISGSDDGLVRLWDTTSGKLIRTFAGHKSRVRTVAISPDGRLLVSGAAEGDIKSWELETGTELPPFNGHARDVSRVAFSPDGTRLASSSGDTTVKIWDVGSRREIQTLSGNASPVADVLFAPKGDVVVSAGWDGLLRFWDTASRQEPWIFQQPGGGSSPHTVPMVAIGAWRGSPPFGTSTVRGSGLERPHRLVPIRSARTESVVHGILRFDATSETVAVAGQREGDSARPRKQIRE
jgi:WD40 repeat protein